MDEARRKVDVQLECTFDVTVQGGRRQTHDQLAVQACCSSWRAILKSWAVEVTVKESMWPLHRPSNRSSN